MTKTISSGLSIDATAIGSTESRKKLMHSIDELGWEYTEVQRFWDYFPTSTSTPHVPESTLVIGDLARIVRHYSSSPARSWVTGVREARPYFLAFVRTQNDHKYASLVDDLLRHSDMRMRVCGEPSDKTEVRSCLADALAAFSPETIISVRFVSDADRLWVEFGDGLSGFVDWGQMGIGDERSRLVAESATVGSHGTTVELTTVDDDVFEIDASSIRGVIDESFARRLGEQAQRIEQAVGERLRSAREERGLTQTELGRLVGIDQAIISKMERGKHTPRLDTLRRIADGLGFSVPGLLSGV